MANILTEAREIFVLTAVKMLITKFQFDKGVIHMKKQLQGITLLLVSILLMLGYGNIAFFDLSFRWSAIFTIVGLVGVVMAFLPNKKD